MNEIACMIYLRKQKTTVDEQVSHGIIPMIDTVTTDYKVITLQALKIHDDLYTYVHKLV